MLEIIGLAVVVLIVAVLVFAATKPDTFSIERSMRIDAAPEKVFEFINDFRQWGAWSPWEKKDPAMTKRFGVEPSGQGATYAWSGNKKVGEGSMEIVESVPPSALALKLDFVKPFEAHNRVEFTLRHNAGATTVTWAMHGPSNYISKLMQVFINLDRMVGKDFEAGLANLKTAAER